MKRTAAILTAVTLAATLQAAERPGGSASAALSVSATVVARTLAVTEYQAQALVVSAADVARGYVDVPRATRLAVTSNSANGYLLAFESTEPLFTEVQVSGAGDRVSLASGNGWILQPFTASHATVELSYRFMLSPGARPGQYPWPLAVSTRAL